MTGHSPTRCTLICLTSNKVPESSKAAMKLAKLFVSSCQLLLVNPAEEEMRKVRAVPRTSDSGINMQFLAFGKSIGVDATLQRLSFEASLKHLEALQQSDILIVVQPEHPLDRQTLSFVSLSAAAEKAFAPTLFVPANSSTSTTGIVFIGPDDGSEMSLLANRLAATHQLDISFLNCVQSAKMIRQRIIQQPSTARPALIIAPSDWLNVDAISPSRLAASCRTPVLVY